MSGLDVGSKFVRNQNLFVSGCHIFELSPTFIILISAVNIAIAVAIVLSVL